jgi:hypothetical protein
MNDFTEKFFLNNVNNSDIVPQYRLGRRIKIGVHGEGAGKIKFEEGDYFAKSPFISTFTISKENGYEYKYWKREDNYYVEIKPISEGYRFKNWKTTNNKPKTPLPTPISEKEKPQLPTSITNTKPKVNPRQSEIDKAINELILKYRSLEKTDKIKLKYAIEINNGKGLQNEEQFRIFAKSTLEGFLDKNPNAKIEDAKNNLINTLNKCFK